MNSSIDETVEQLEADFAMFDSWEEKYEYVMDLGRNLNWPDHLEQREDLLIQGCQSKVWLDHELQENKIIFYAASEALIVKGLVAMLLNIYSNRSPEEILRLQPDFLDRIGLSQHLSPTRSNGLHSMLATIKRIALAYYTG